MKKLSILAFALFVCSIVFGQWSVGPRLGVNFSTLTGKWDNNDNSKTKWVTGPVAGAVGDYSFTDLISLRAELLYITMGEKTINENDGGRSANDEAYFFKERYNCMQMILLAHFFWNINVISLYATAGPYFTYKFGGRWSDPNGDGVIVWGTRTYKSGDDKYYVDPDYNRRFDFGSYIGGGVGKDLGPGRLELDLRFGYGFLDLNKFDSKEERNQAKDNGYKPYRNLNISVSLAYMYLFKKK